VVVSNEYYIFIAGPSLAVDTACATGLYVIDQAVRSIRSGQCDAAVVGAANAILHPRSTLNFFKLGVLSPDGASKSFDASGLFHSRYLAIDFYICLYCLYGVEALEMHDLKRRTKITEGLENDGLENDHKYVNTYSRR